MVQEGSIGKWAFIIGVIIAVIAGAMGGWVPAYMPWVALVLVVLGLVVGFLNIGAKETNDFLLAAIALILVGTLTNLTSIPVAGTTLMYVVAMVSTFVAPAALVVSLKAVYSLASKPATV